MEVKNLTSIVIQLNFLPVVKVNVDGAFNKVYSITRLPGREMVFYRNVQIKAYREAI